ncbi:MAG: hypothetical protein GW778_00390 [Alphaproteobacteria bacterium]|nr:hypothetical protein [Alphaproteobacteria bacterium]
MVKGFNAESEKPQFIYKQTVKSENVYEILMFRSKGGPGQGKYEIVGDYTVIDEDENLELSEQKVKNVISLLNGKDDLKELGNLTKTRVLFTIVPKKSEDDPTKIIFRNHDGKGTSEENAVLTIEKGVLNESQIRIPESE